MKIIVLFLALIWSSIALAQNNYTQALIAPQGFGTNLLNSSGNSSIDNHISNIGFMNPASLSNFDNYSFGLSYQLNSDLNEGWIADIGVKRINDLMPQSAGAVVKLNDFSFGLGFGQKYNAELLFDPIPITTTTDPDGTGEFITVEYRTRIQSYSLSASYSFPEIFGESSSLDIGFRYSVNHLKFYQGIGETNIDESDNLGSYAIGFQYSNQISDSKRIRVGFSYEIEPDFEKTYEYKNDLIYINDPDSTGRIPAVITSKYNLVGSIPDKFNLDVSADITESFRLNAMITGVLWEADNEYLKNQLEFSASGIYRINEMFAPSFGFYYTDKNYDDNFFDINENLDALFLIGGFRFTYEILSMDLAIADSHLFSDDYRKQTIGKLAIGVQL